MKKRAIIIVCLLLAIACSDDRDSHIILDKVAAQMAEHPDSAKITLELINRNTIKSRKEKAYFALLYSQALDKNYIDIDNDSLIKQAVDYYGSRSDTKQKSLSYYYYARVLQNNGNYDEALGALSKAEITSLDIDDDYLKGLIADCRGAIYTMNNELTKTIPSYLEAINHYQEINHAHNIMLVYGNIAKIYARLSDNDNSLEYAQKAKVIAESLADTVGIITYTTNIAYIYLNENQPQKALDIVMQTCQKYYGQLPEVCYPLVSTIYLAIDNIDNARKIASDYKTKNDKVPGIYALLGKIEQYAKNYKKSNEYYISYMYLSDSLKKAQYEKAIYEIDQKYRNNELQNEIIIIKERSSTQRLIYFLSIIIVIAIFLIIIIQRQKLILVKDAYIQEYKERVSAIQDYCETLNNIKKFQTDVNLRSKSVIENQLSILTNLLNIVGVNRELTASDYHRFKSLCYNSKLDNQEIAAVFKQVFELKYPGVIPYLTSSYQSIGSDDINYYCLICLGCSATVLSFINRTSTSYVYNKRMSIRKKLNFTSDNQSFSEHLNSILEKI